MLEGNLQILLRSKKGEKQKALSVFYDANDCHDLYPEWVDCKEKGLWRREEVGSHREPKGGFKVWGAYARHHPEADIDEDNNDGTNGS